MKINDIQKILLKKFNIIPRFVSEYDAEFILSLRLDNHLGRFLSPTQNDINIQINWLREYKERERRGQEFYFIFENNDGKYGLTRIYNITKTKFESGSWIFAKNSPLGVSILADLYNRSFGFENLCLKECAFEVRKENRLVVKYHQMFNPTLLKEDNLNYYFSITKQKFEICKNRIIKLYYL